METSTLVFYGACGLLIIMFLVFLKSGNFIKNFLYSGFSGLIGLLATYAVGLFTAPLIVISPLSLVVSVILGLPGVISLLVVNIIT